MQDEDLGLEKICGAHELVIFDKSALCAPFKGRLIFAYDPRFEQFAELLERFPNRRIPQRLSQSLAWTISDARYTASRLYMAFQYHSAGVGRNDHRGLRKQVLKIAKEKGIEEYDRCAIFLAVSCVRDTKKRDAKNTAYVSGLPKNVEVFNELLEIEDVVKEKAASYLWNGTIYEPVKSVKD